MTSVRDSLKGLLKKSKRMMKIRFQNGKWHRQCGGTQNQHYIQGRQRDPVREGMANDSSQTATHTIALNSAANFPCSGQAKSNTVLLLMRRAETSLENK